MNEIIIKPWILVVQLFKEKNFNIYKKYTGISVYIYTFDSSGEL